MQTSQTDIKVQDAIANSWVDRYAPLGVRPYLRLSRMDRPVGSWLLFYPCVVGAAAAALIYGSEPLTMLRLLVVCLVGAWLMRGAGCTWNDYIDREIDAQVARTKSRPLPSGAVTPRQALVWMVAQALVAFAFLLTLSKPAIVISIISLGVVAIYPFAKRFTDWPQLVLGLAFNWGILTAWVEITGGLDWTALLLYAGFIGFTLFYDSIYAFQDIEDDAIIGVRSSARQIAARPNYFLLRFAAGFALGVIVTAVLAMVETRSIFALAIVAGIIHAAYYLQAIFRRFDPHQPRIALQLFRESTKIARALGFWWLAAWLGHFVVFDRAALVIGSIIT